MRFFPALLLLLTAREAQAWEVFFRVTSETTFRGSSETSSASTRADRAERTNRGKSGSTSGGRSEGTQCVSDDECFGYCEEGRCVDDATPATAPPTQNTPIEVHPANPIDPSYQPDPPAPIVKCVSDDQCPQGQSCINGQCLSPPPPPPPSASLWKRGAELYLRERTVQLREELALGEGPMISTLATRQGVSASKLGRAMRAQRSELMRGAGTDPRWTARFLLQLEALCVQPASLSVR